MEVFRSAVEEDLLHVRIPMGVRLARKLDLSAASSVPNQVTRKASSGSMIAAEETTQGEVVPLWIDGNPVVSSDHTFDVHHPSTNAHARSVVVASVDETLRAISSCQEAFKAWATTSLYERRKILNKAADFFLERKEEFISAWSGETSAPRPFQDFNVHLSEAIIRETASLTSHLGGDMVPTRDGATSLVVKEPYGVVFSLAPWNAPLILSIRAIVAPLMCGNTVLLKGSDATPKTHYLWGQLFKDAGLPDGCLNIVNYSAQEAPQLSELIIVHKDVRLINFTGSTKVGRILAQHAAKAIKPIILELGGKSASIVLDDADLDLAVNNTLWGSFLNTGQICMGTEIIMVDESVANGITEKLEVKMKTLKTEDKAPLSTGLFSSTAAEGIVRLVKDALNKGATLVGSTEIDLVGNRLQPIVLTNVNPSMDIYYQDVFGPVVLLVRFSGVEEAIAKTNDLKHGLAASVFSKDYYGAVKIARRLNVGSVQINAPTVYDDASVPFGGTKDSGYGRFNGSHSINSFTQIKSITLHDPAIRPGI